MMKEEYSENKFSKEQYWRTHTFQTEILAQKKDESRQCCISMKKKSKVYASQGTPESIVIMKTWSITLDLTFHVDFGSGELCCVRLCETSLP